MGLERAVGQKWRVTLRPRARPPRPRPRAADDVGRVGHSDCLCVSDPHPAQACANRHLLFASTNCGLHATPLFQLRHVLDGDGAGAGAAAECAAVWAAAARGSRLRMRVNDGAGAGAATEANAAADACIVESSHTESRRAA